MELKEGVKLAKPVVEMIREGTKKLAATADDQCLGVETVKELLDYLHKEFNQSKPSLRESLWTTAYCLCEFAWSEEARALARSEIVKLSVAISGDHDENGDLAPALKKIKTVGGLKLNQHLIGICVNAVGTCGTKKIGERVVDLLWGQAMKDSKVTGAERWTLRYCIAAFLFEQEARQKLIRMLRLADYSAFALSDNEPRILLVSDNLEQFELLIQAAKENVVVVPIRYDTWQLEDFTKAVETRAGKPHRQYASVGFLDHGAPGELCFLKSVGHGGRVGIDDFEKSEKLQTVFKFMAGYVKEPLKLHEWQTDLASRIDLMACSVADSTKGPLLIQYLEKLTKVNWAASTKKIGVGGDVANGFSWNLDTEHDLGDVHVCYFLPEKLQKWRHSFCGPKINIVNIEGGSHTFNL